MATAKSTQKSGPSSGTNLSSISSVLKLLLSAFSLPQKPATPIPPPLLLLADSRPGMSGRNLAANIISRVDAEAGIPMGDVFADGPNRDAAALFIASQEKISHIQQNAKVSTIIKPGSVQITAIGTAGPIPVVVQGANTIPTPNSGVIQ
jgi:hypothetical protein